jgi:predicted PurR-regulated permease PerM
LKTPSEELESARPPLAVDEPSRNAGEEGVPTALPRSIQSALTSSTNLKSFAVNGLFVLAVLYTLYLASEFVLPVILALVMCFLLMPIVRFFRKFKIPAPLGAAFSIIAFLICFLLLASLVSQPLAAFVQDFPLTVIKVQYKIAPLLGPLRELGRTSQQVERMFGPSNESASTLVALRQQSLLQVLFSQTPAFLARLVVVLVLGYFLLAHQRSTLAKIVKAVPTFEDKRQVVEVAEEIQWLISRYLTSVTLLNLALGLCIGVSLTALGLPNGMMWGAVAFLLNYIPFVGSACGIAMVALAALIQFDNLWYACLCPGIYLFFNAAESNFVTPHILGRWMILNPLAIILSFLFWGWLWGIPGMLLAVPILATAKILCDRVSALSVFGEFLGR